MGWDAFKVRINVTNLGRSIRGVPALEIDVAAPEALLDTSVSTIDVGGHQVFAYTLERIAGEKLRAFLSSLPAYRRKVSKPGSTVRAKDLYDIARIHRHHDIANVGFWTMVGKEFRSACRSRYIDCDGLSTFQEEWDVTRSTYAKEAVLKDLPFEEVEAVLTAVVRFLEANRFIPCSFPLPA
jgi:hypothetical protein